MSIQALAWAIEQALPGPSKLVLMALANHADHTNGYVHFDATNISREASIEVRSLWRYLGALERNGYVAKDERKAGDTEKREYWLVLDREPALGWSWSAQDQSADDSRDDAPPPAPSEAPKAFRRVEQDKAREVASAPSDDRPPGMVGVIEGTDAFREWCGHYRDVLHKPPPFVMAIKIADGKDARGFYQPSLFPPRQDRIENLEGAA